MTLEHLLAFNAALLVALVSPGPALLLMVRTALARGRRAGIACGIGLASVAASYTLLALFGLAGLFAVVPWLYTAAKIAGALYLVWLAIATWRGARSPIVTDGRAAHRAFREGALVNLLNPKSVLFAAAVLVVIFPPDLSLADKLVIGANHLAVEIVAYTLFAVLLSTPTVSRRYLAAKTALDRAAALVLGALGLRLLVSR